jgi:predicted negative regulator of RcsB-dependent stress response
VELYNSDEEQVAALKQWWDKNGTTLIIALVIFLAGVLGFRSWQDYKMSQAESASVIYQQMSALLESSPDKAMEVGLRIVAEYPSSGYASMASLAMARLALQKGEPGAAAAHFRSVMESASTSELKQIARLRLARVLLTQGKSDEAMNILNAAEAGNFRAAYDEVRGDIYLAQGNRQEARNAYANALDGYENLSSKRELLQMKIDDLADARVETQ